MTQLRIHERWPVALLILIVLAALTGLGTFVYQKHLHVEKLVAEVDVRYSRMLGLKASQPQMAQLADGVNLILAQQAYPATQDATQAANDAQQRIRALFAGAGLEVVSIQVMAAKQEKHFDRIPLAVRLEGQLTQWQSSLVALAALKPTVFVEGLSVQTIGFVKAETPQKLGIQLTLYVMRSRP